jgi:hypothetical protein
VDFGHILTIVVAYNVLPGLTTLAKYGTAIVILEITDALDSIGLVVFFLD